MKRLVAYGRGQHTTDYIFATRLIGNISWRPIWDYIIATEHTRVAQMRWVTERLGVPPRAVRQIKTDCIVLQPARKLIPKLVAMCEIRHCDLPDQCRRTWARRTGRGGWMRAPSWRAAGTRALSFAGLAGPR